MAINFTNLNNACVLYYSMDNADVSGSTILDLTPNNNDGTINGATTGVTGILNEAFSFDGVDDEVDVGTGTQFQPSKIFISLWSEIPDYNNWRTFLTKRDSNREYQFYIYKNTGEISFDIGSTGYKGDVVTTNQLNHYVVAHDGTDLKIFINGQLTNTFTNVNSLSYSSNEPVKIGTDNVGNFYKGDMDELVMLTDDWTSAGTAQELATYFYNSGTPTVNQQYPMSANVETLEVDTLSLTNSLQDVNIKNIINEELDVLQINSNLQDITFKNTIKEELQPLTLSLSLQDISFSSADILNLSPLQFNSSLQDITFKNVIKEDLDTLTFNQELQDVEIKNVIQFTLDPLEFNLELLNVAFPLPDVETLELEPLVFNLGLNDIRFELVTSPLLDSARNDIQQVLEEIGEPITYRRYVKTFDDVGQLKEVTTTDYSTLALFEDGDDKNKETNQYGEFIAGTQNVNLAYQITNGVIPKVRDILIDLNGVKWEIIQVKPSRLYGAVWDNNVTVQRKTNFQ